MYICILVSLKKKVTTNWLLTAAIQDTYARDNALGSTKGAIENKHHARQMQALTSDIHSQEDIPVDMHMGGWKGRNKWAVNIIKKGRGQTGMH